MTRTRRIVVAVTVLSVLATSVALAQFRGGRGWGRGYDNWQDVGRGGVPDWEFDRNFPDDTFTFVRIKYTSTYGRRGHGWATDFRDSDLNFSLRLHQLTSLEVNPEPIVLELTDPRLFDYPFIYMIEPGALCFEDEELPALRQYCLNGGFLMVDDFWGDDEWLNFYEQIKRVFPDREVVDVPLEHEIFHSVYDLKERPQVPSIHAAEYGRSQGITWERGWGDTEEPHYRAIYDDAGRIMVFICHNTDLGDGWEEEAVDPWYFEEFSVKKSYPMGINIVTYAMTH